MDFLAPIRRRFRTERKKVGRGKASPAVAKSVLNFLSYGLTEGAESLRQNHSRGSKVDEFVIVSGEILGALKREYEKNFPDDSVTLCMRVNHELKRIELIGLGHHVMMTLDGTSIMINNTSLAELYANIRNDIIKHGEIYGKDLQLTAFSSPAPKAFSAFYDEI